MFGIHPPTPPTVHPIDQQVTMSATWFTSPPLHLASAHHFSQTVQKQNLVSYLMHISNMKIE